MKRMPKEVRDGTRRTALHAASQMGFASVVQILMLHWTKGRCNYASLLEVSSSRVLLLIPKESVLEV